MLFKWRPRIDERNRKGDAIIRCVNEVRRPVSQKERKKEPVIISSSRFRKVLPAGGVLLERGRQEINDQSRQLNVYGEEQSTRNTNSIRSTRPDGLSSDGRFVARIPESRTNQAERGRQRGGRKGRETPFIACAAPWAVPSLLGGNAEKKGQERGPMKPWRKTQSQKVLQGSMGMNSFNSDATELKRCWIGGRVWREPRPGGVNM